MIKVKYKPSDEIWLFKTLDFGASKEAAIVVKELKQFPDDYGFVTERFIVMKRGEYNIADYEAGLYGPIDSWEWDIAFAPADKSGSYADKDTLEKHCSFYMTMGEFKALYGTNLI